MRNRQSWMAVLLAVGALAGCNVLRAGMKSSYTMEKAKVEQVIQAESNGHRFVAYLVAWKGTPVVVSDNLARSHHHTGDEISFMAQRIELPGHAKILSFTLMEP